MKTIKCCLVIFTFAFNILELSAQSFCATVSDTPDILQAISPNQFQVVEETYTVRIFFHIIRKTNGTGGQTLAEVETALNVLNSDYAAHGISFLLLGIDEIKDDATYNRTQFYVRKVGNVEYYDDDNDGKFDIFHPNSHPDAIDIYLFANDKLNFGLACGIPGTALVIGGNAFGSNLASARTLSHEVGHCLGLYHTFHGLCEGGCPESPNGSNSSTCGDFVVDTPADPQKFQVNQSTCTWDGITCTGSNGSSYSPNVHLIMAYVPPSCMQYHTSGQGARMRSVIANSTLLQNVVETCPTIYINNQIYSSGTQTVSGCKIEIANTTINSGATVNIHAQEKATLKTGFWAKSGSTVSIKATQASSNNLLSTQAVEVENEANSLTLLEQAMASPQNGNIDFTVYPNPNDGNFTVKITGNVQAYAVEIFNVSSRIMGKVDCNSETITINRSDLLPGVYYLKLSTGSESAVKKLVVK
jgi:hypothetical protein